MAEEIDDAAEEHVASFFAEADEVLGLIGGFSDPKAAHEAAAERIAAVLDRYQEQPSILDPQLEAMVTPLLEAVRQVARGRSERRALPHACRVMYTLCKVRGDKTIVKFVPHEVADLEPLVQLLASVEPADHASWQVAYSLMVWLSMVVMVPFDLSIIDSSTAGADADGAEPPTAPSRRRRSSPRSSGSRAATWTTRARRATRRRSCSPGCSRAPACSASSRASSRGAAAGSRRGARRTRARAWRRARWCASTRTAHLLTRIS